METNASSSTPRGRACCLDFNQVKAYKRTSCLFEHALIGADAAEKFMAHNKKTQAYKGKPLEVCHDFIKGKCRVGDVCRFSHKKKE